MPRGNLIMKRHCEGHTKGFNFKLTVCVPRGNLFVLEM
jgi:hypothetical protein